MDNEYQEFTGKTLEDAVIEAATKIGTTTSNLQYEVVTRGTSGFLGIGAKPFVIKAKGKNSIDEEIDQILSGNVPEKKVEKKTEKSKKRLQKRSSRKLLISKILLKKRKRISFLQIQQLLGKQRNILKKS